MLMRCLFWLSLDTKRSLDNKICSSVHKSYQWPPQSSRLNLSDHIRDSNRPEGKFYFFC